MTSERAGNDVLQATAHRSFPLPSRAWLMRQRWNDLLFAHWPLPPSTVESLLPPGLAVDTFDREAWVGVVPFWMDRIQQRLPGTGGVALPLMPGFPELNLRTYVRSRLTGNPGVYFFSLDAANPLAVLGARALFHLPYFFAGMRRETSSDGTVRYQSQRLFARGSGGFQAIYRGLGRAADALPSRPGTIEHFLTERYCLFTTFQRRVLVGNVHHEPWPLEAAEAELRSNSLSSAHGFQLPSRAPLLHFSRSLEVYIWALENDGFV